MIRSDRPGGVLVAGSANADFVVRARHVPAPGETLLGGDLSVFPGGKGANQAVAAARAGGAQTAMVVALGEDDQARLLIRSLEGAGVELHIRRSARSTGAALITVSDEGENAITVAPGANADLRPEDLPPLDAIAWLAMQLETPLETVLVYARSAQVQGVRVLLNAAPARALPEALLRAVDVLVVNEEELTALVGEHGSIAERLARTGVAITVATLGSRGAVALVDGDYLVQPAFAVTPVDTTAAGDAFCGVLVADLAAGEALGAALRRAAAAAALVTTRAGAQSSIPTRAEVVAFMAEAQPADHRPLALYCGIGATAG
ncbi:PfkB family carbohydrate kinase [Sphingomonas sp. 66-10]|uniref:PfkB family carbohydrate kinase n=1 Tax=Sphingomonas sp. 66-10 TaxID=1895848 RepID=UPI000A6F87CB|nr:PfkB family carbohydrate kinase [Sphingomonas sp. 66-10]